MRYVFDTDGCKRYRFPTHINDLVIDRKESAVSEAFVVIVESGMEVRHHKHEDMEQLFYILEGKGILMIGVRKTRYTIEPNQMVRIPPGTLHSVRPVGKTPIRYLSIDCFLSSEKGNEPTWEHHVGIVCKEQGYRFEEVAAKKGSNRKN